MVSPDRAHRTSANGSMVKKLLWRVSVPVAALVLGFVGGAAILIWGLVTPFFIVWPLALGTAALWSAAGASWTGTFLAPDLTHSRPLRTFLVSGIVALVLTAGVLVAPLLSSVVFPPLIWFFGSSAILIATATSIATWRFRVPRERLGWQVFGPLALSALTMVVTLAGFTGMLGLVGIWEWWALALVSSVNLLAVAASMVLLRRGNWNRESLSAKDAAITLGLVGLPAPIFFGAYYLAFLFDLTSG